MLKTPLGPDSVEPFDLLLLLLLLLLKTAFNNLKGRKKDPRRTNTETDNSGSQPGNNGNKINEAKV